MAEARRHVSSHLVFESDQPLNGVLQIAVTGMVPARVEEELIFFCDGEPVDVIEVMMPNEARVQVLRAPPGRYTVEYKATILGNADPPGIRDADRVTFLRPSRYVESDRLVSIAQDQFYAIDGPTDLLAAVSSWVGSRLNYEPGSSGPTRGAVDTFLQRDGVCRDYAHLVAALLRALGIPARFIAVYAPGLSPMDFHAVVEALVQERWCVVDATLLAPRSSLVRIATGRDAADTAFLSTYGGAVNLLESEVTAVVDGPLPRDDIAELVSLR
jgi:transglutaminase-like putative cysteine protease